MLLSHSLLSHSLSTMPADLAVAIAVEFDVTLTVALVVALAAVVLTFALAVAIAFAEMLLLSSHPLSRSLPNRLLSSRPIVALAALTVYSAASTSARSCLILLVGCGDARIPLFVDNQSSLLRLILIGLGGSPVALPMTLCPRLVDSQHYDYCTAHLALSSTRRTRSTPIVLPVSQRLLLVDPQRSNCTASCFATSSTRRPALLLLHCP